MIQNCILGSKLYVSNPKWLLNWIDYEHLKYKLPNICKQLGKSPPCSQAKSKTKVWNWLISSYCKKRINWFKDKFIEYLCNTDSASKSFIINIYFNTIANVTIVYFPIASKHADNSNTFY